MRAAIYKRISKDKTGEAEGIERQEEDCQALAEAKGWKVVETFTDNDTSAVTSRRRPAFEDLMGAVERRAIDVIVAWNADRVYRTPADRLRVVEACRANDVSLHLVRGTGIDMTTPNGRMLAGMLGEMAWAEVENKSDRQRRANRQAAEKGKPWMTGPRPFGYERVNGTLAPHEKEAAVLRDAFAMLTAGSSLYSVTKMLNASGLASTRGNEWKHNNVRVMLLNPLYAGLRAYAEMPPLGVRESKDEEGKKKALEARRERRMLEKRPLVSGTWEPLVPEDVWRAAVSILRDPARTNTLANFASGVRWLGSNIYLCLRCEEQQGTEADAKRTGDPVMAVNWTTNASRKGQRGHRIYKCKRCFTSRRADPVDEFVEATIAARLDRNDGRDLVVPDSASRTDVAALRREAGDVRARLDVLADTLADGEMTKDQFARANRRARDRLAEIEGELAEAGRTNVLADLQGPGAGDRWLTSDDIRWRRAVLAAVVDVVLCPVKTGRPRKGEEIDPSSVVFRWRTS